MAYQFTAQDLLAVSMLGVPVGHYALHVLAQALAGLGIEPGSGPPQLFWDARPWPSPDGQSRHHASPPPDRRLAHRRPPLTPAQIWKRLVDDHDVDIPYGTVAQYTARHRPRLLRLIRHEHLATPIVSTVVAVPLPRAATHRERAGSVGPLL